MPSSEMEPEGSPVSAESERIEDAAPEPIAEPAKERLHRRVMRALEWELRDLDGATFAILTVAAVLLVVFKTFGGSSAFQDKIAPAALRSHARISVFGDFWWFTSCFVLLGVLPALMLARMAKKDGVMTGLGLGDVRFGLRWVAILYAVMLPVLVIASRTPTFWQFYPLNDQIQGEATTWLRGHGPPEWPAWFVAFEALYVLYFVGWEYFFRGFLTFGLYPKLGFNGVLVANVPFALMHAGKPFPEALGSVIAGLALGLFALRSRSFWYCWLLHALIAVTMDLLAIERRFAMLP